MRGIFDVERLRPTKNRCITMREVGVARQDDGDRADVLGGSWQIVKDLVNIRFAPQPSRVLDHVNDAPAVAD